VNKNSKCLEKACPRTCCYGRTFRGSSGTLVIANLSLFFVSRLVIEKGYYYTFCSLFFQGVVEIADVVPHRLFHGLWFYLMILTFEAFALCFLDWYLIEYESGSVFEVDGKVNGACRARLECER
jgi:hypothetical protein